MRRVGFVLLLLGCAALYLVTQARLRIAPAVQNVEVTLNGKFTPGGQYPGQPFSAAGAVRNWGSWSGSDDNEGSLAIGPFAAPAVLRIGLSGYPDHEGNELYLEKVDSTARF